MVGLAICGIEERVLLAYTTVRYQKPVGLQRFINMSFHIVAGGRSPRGRSGIADVERMARLRCVGAASFSTIGLYALAHPYPNDMSLF